VFLLYVGITMLTSLKKSLTFCTSLAWTSYHLLMYDMYITQYNIFKTANHMEERHVEVPNTAGHQ
jgi:hypothetical protein